MPKSVKKYNSPEIANLLRHRLIGGESIWGRLSYKALFAAVLYKSLITESKIFFVPTALCIV